MSKHNRERRTFRQIAKKPVQRASTAYEVLRMRKHGRIKLAGKVWK